MTDLLGYVYFLTKVSKIGNSRIRSIIGRIRNYYDFCNCSQSDLRKIEGIDAALSAEIIRTREHKSGIEEEFEKLKRKAESEKIGIISLFDEEYPYNLKNIFDAPVILYYKGRLDRSDRFSISIVGTRNPTQYGKYVCEKFTESLSYLEIPVISGFARGIDTIVHRTCIKNNTLTYAVFGCGVDVIYPNDNRKLYDELMKCGASISEFPPGSLPEKVNFPRRNRLISGISLGSLIVESGIKGGSLLTAEFAIDQNREVFALPGYINSKQSEGTNELIKKGQAKLVTCIDDIIMELENKLKPYLKKEMAVKEKKMVTDLNEKEKKLYDSIEYDPVHIDKINESTGMTVSDCLVNLLALEFKGLIRQLPGKNFVKA